MLQRYANFLGGLVLGLDVLCLAMAWTARPVFGWDTGEAGWLVGERWKLIPFAALWICSAWLFRLHRSPFLGRRHPAVRDFLAANSFFVGLVIGLASFLANPPAASAFPLLWIVSLSALVFSRVIGLSVLHTATEWRFNRRSLLIVGTGTRAQDLVRRLHAMPEYGCIVKGYLSESPGEIGRRYEGVPVMGTIYDVGRLAQSDIDLVWFCLPSYLEPCAEKLLHELRNSTVDVKWTPSLAGTETLGLEAYMFEGLPMITLQGARVHGWHRALKRAVDIVGSALALAGTAPLLLLIALFIKLSSPGPVLFRQTRMSLPGQPFVMLKFRTMYAEAERDSGPVWAPAPHDPRVTPFGRILRKTSLDELPQFWNVFKGEMSLVGPRPERPTFIDMFRRAHPAYMLRLKVKAGMTGWAQINGWRGNTCLQTRIAHDLYYIEHWSLWFDLKILCQTLWKGMRHENAC
jgi:exopolysaccharide biosynthesis polyprenyl glycosylphosphotransferase